MINPFSISHITDVGWLDNTEYLFFIWETHTHKGGGTHKLGGGGGYGHPQSFWNPYIILYKNKLAPTYVLIGPSKKIHIPSLMLVLVVSFLKYVVVVWSIKGLRQLSLKTT